MDKDSDSLIIRCFDKIFITNSHFFYKEIYCTEFQTVANPICICVCVYGCMSTWISIFRWGTCLIRIQRKDTEANEKIFFLYGFPICWMIKSPLIAVMIIPYRVPVTVLTESFTNAKNSHVPMLPLACWVKTSDCAAFENILIKRVWHKPP